MAVVTTQIGGQTVANDVLRMSSYCWIDSQIGIFSMHYLNQAVVGGASISCGAAANFFATTVDPSIQPLQIAATSILGAKAAVVNRTPAPLSGIATDSAVGTEVSTILPTQTSGIIKVTTAKAGKAFRGRIYVPFPYAAAVDSDGTPTAAYVTRLGNYAITINASFAITDGGATATFIPVLYHRATRLYDQVVNMTAQKRWATQRRRGNYGRTNLAVIT